eukprot:scaffold819_cov350-Prasinococcus_capsulatus_cf.AAC.13
MHESHQCNRDHTIGAMLRGGAFCSARAASSRRCVVVVRVWATYRCDGQRKELREPPGVGQQPQQLAPAAVLIEGVVEVVDGLQAS